mmetsp:Transcript_30100/g.52894  ORF Transcript_30100/g.52894 Transcript_30100/m.52894 type:complete len:461 (-) Transcript_30100:78-1460(-)
MSAKVTPIDDVTYGGENGGDKDERRARHDEDKVKRRQTGLFAFSNTEAIKERVRATKLPPKVYNTHDQYWETGFIQKVARHPMFENTTLAVIVINAFWIMIDTDYNDADTINKADAGFVFADAMFFTYFTMELVIRFLAFKRKSKCLRDGWFVFDTTLVALYTFDPFILGIMAVASGGEGVNLPTSILRLFRLARLSRLVRMLRSFPELMIMIKGMISAVSVVLYIAVLLLIITYVFAIALVNMTQGTPLQETHENDGYFSSVGEAIISLMVYATFLDNLADFIYAVMDQGSWICPIIAWLYILIAAVTVMNMLIGVLCEVIDGVSAEENETIMVDRVQDKFGKIVRDLDENSDGFLTWEEFKCILDIPDAMDALESVGVNPDTLIDAAEDFFFEDGVPVKVTFDEFMTMLLDMRASETATVKHIMTMSKRVHGKFLKVHNGMDKLDKKMDRLSKMIPPH